MKKKVKKKTTVSDEDLTVVGQLTDAQYWKWRLTVEELHHAKTKSEKEHLLCALKMMELEKGKLELTLARTKAIEIKKLEGDAQEEYARIKTEIENEAGLDMNGCVVDPHTFKVKKLDETPK